MSAPQGAAPAQRLSLPLVMAFACTSLPLSALGLAVSVHLPNYFAANIGVPLTVVAAAFATTRLIDIPVDPALGLLQDRTRTPWGRYRIWTLIGAPILCLALYALFMSPAGATTTYLIAWLLVMYLGSSILTLSHVAWATTLATNYHERSRIFAVMTAVGIVGAAMVLIIPVVMERIGYSNAEGVRAMGWFAIVLTPIACLIVAIATPERIAPEAPGAHFNIKDYTSLIARPNMLRIMAADLCLSLGPGWMAALYLFYFRDARGFNTTAANLLLLLYVLAGLAGAPATAALARRIGKHRALFVNTTGYSLILICVALIPKGSVLLAVPAMFFAGAFAAGFGVMTRAITADVSDEVRLDQGKERAGLMYALTTFTSKVAGAASIFLTFNVLARVGYQPAEGASNSAAAIHGLELAYIIGPIVFVMIGGLCFIGYKLGPDEHAEVRRQLDERDALYADAPGIATLEDPTIVSHPR